MKTVGCIVFSRAVIFKKNSKGEKKGGWEECRGGQGKRLLMFDRSNQLI